MATWEELEKAGTTWADLSGVTWAELEETCEKGSSNIAQKDLEDRDGEYPIYGASGFIKNVDFYQQETPYIAVVKDGAGVGRVMRLPAKSSVIGTMQYILPKNNVDTGYLAYALEHMNLSKYYTGATIPHIYFKDYKKEKFPLPPLDEQRRIAAVLDKVSGLIAKRREQLDKLDELVKARFVEMFGDPEFNLRNWPIVSISDVCTVGSSKRIYQSEQTFDGVPFLRISDLNHLIDTGDFCPSLFISEEKYQELQQRGQVPIEGDILVTSRGTLGRCYIIKTTDRFYFQDGMISWISNLSNEITSLFIAHLFDMQSIKRRIESMQAGSTVSYLSIDMIKRLKIMLPDRNLQKQFGAFVDQTNKSKLTIQQSLDKLEVMKKALMQKYFG